MSVLAPSNATVSSALVREDFSPEDVLEPGQLSKARRERLPRRRVGPGVLAMMWVMRLYVFLALPLVAYVFFESLKASGHF